MNHSFDINIAKKYGIEEAILLQYIYFWVEKNRANNQNFYDGNFWTYNTKKAFAELFPYMTPRKIDYALNNLIVKGLIVTGYYNEKPTDRTLWYALTKMGYCILQNCEMENTKMENVYNKDIYNNTDIKHTFIDKENIKENDDYSGKEIIPPKKVEELTKGSNALNIFHHWNESNIIQHRELTTDIRKQIDKVLKEYSVEQIKIAISHYAEALHSDYEYCSYKWSLEKFLKQDNCLKDYLDDGSKWINYLEYKNKKTYSNKKELSKETSYPDYKDKNYL